jgi:Peptidase family M28
MMRRPLFQAPLTSVSREARQKADSINENDLRSFLTFIAADALMGRDTPSQGLDTAAEFIAFNLRRFGARPGGDNGTFFQKIPLTRNNVVADKCVFTVGEKTLKYAEDFLAAGRISGSGRGDLVYVGHGYKIPTKNIDAYGSVDVRGKILVVNGAGLPKGVAFADLQNGRAGEDWFDAFNYALKNGAEGIIQIAGPGRWNGAQKSLSFNGGYRMPSDKPAVPPLEGIPTLLINTEAASVLFDGSRIGLDTVLGHTRSGETTLPVPLVQSAKVTITYGMEIRNTQNVVAIFDGSDPKLKSEYVAVGAHYDHVGTGRPNKEGDFIFNGADDDGSGTVGLLAMAQALANGPRPKRSIIFVWHAGEEQGLWGSDYFTTHPTIGIKQIVAQLNIDMIGRSKLANDGNPRNANLSRQDEIFVIGSKMMSTEFGQLVERVNQSYKKIQYDFRYDDPKDPNRFFYRSDHYNYARKGIPIAFWFDGEHQDYHGLGDEVSKIDFHKLCTIAQTVFLTAWEVANMPKAPVVDKKPAGVNF